MRRFISGTTAAILLFSAFAINVSAAESEADEATVTTLAGTGSHGAADGEFAQFNLPGGLAVSQAGVFVADTFNNLIRFVDLDGQTSTITGTVLPLDHFRFPTGRHRDGTTENALFNRPADIALHPNGNLLVLDAANHSLRLVVPNAGGGRVFTLAGDGHAGYANGTTYEAQFNRPTAMAIDAAGNIFIADSGNHVIRKIDTYGNVTTIAGTPGEWGHADGAANEALFDGPMGIAIGADGKIFVADTGNHLIRTIYNGYVTTLAGVLTFPEDDEWDDVPIGGFADGLYNEAMFTMPRGLTVWQNVLIVADTGNHRIRAVLPDGYVFTLAGGDYPGHEDGPPDEAAFHLPENVFVFEDTLYIADTGNNVIRKINLTYEIRRGN